MHICQIWAAGAEVEADSGDLILQGHRSWGPISDVRVILLNPNHEVSEANCIFLNAPVHTVPITAVKIATVYIFFNTFGFVLKIKPQKLHAFLTFESQTLNISHGSKSKSIS